VCLCNFALFFRQEHCILYVAYYIVVRDLSGSTIVSHYLINYTNFEKKNEDKKCFDFLYNFCLKHFYSKSNQMHNITILFYFGTTLYMFRTVFPSIIWILRLYIQHHTIQVLWLLASKHPQDLYDMYLMLYVQS